MCAGVTNVWATHLKTVALSAFEWEGLPPEVDPRFIELVLYSYGWGGLFDMSESGERFLAFSFGAVQGNWDMYYNPREVQFMAANDSRTWLRDVAFAVRAYARGGIVSKPESVIVWDNLARTPMEGVMRWYAQRLAKVDLTVDQNVAAQACPYIIECDEEQQKVAVNEYLAITTFEPVIVKRKAPNGSPTSINVQNLDTPFVANDLMDAQDRILNRAYTLLGVDNLYSTKKERLIVDEVNGNNEQILAFRQSRLSQRQAFAEKVNAVFGLNVKVRYAMRHDEDGQGDMSQGNGGGVEDGGTA